MDRRIALFGRSVALNSIAAALGAVPELALLQAPVTPETTAEAAARVLAFEPAVVIFDLATGLPDNTVLRPLAHKHVTLLGVDLAGPHMLVLSGEQTQLLTLDDLVRVLALTPEEDPCSYPDH